VGNPVTTNAPPHAIQKGFREGSDQEERLLSQKKQKKKEGDVKKGYSDGVKARQGLSKKHEV